MKICIEGWNSNKNLDRAKTVDKTMCIDYKVAVNVAVDPDWIEKDSFYCAIVVNVVDLKTKEEAKTKVLIVFHQEDRI